MYGNQQTQVPSAALSVEENPVTVARNRLASMTDRVYSFAQHVSQIADVQFGAIAQGELGPADPPRCGESGLLHDALDQHVAALNALDNQIVRIASLGLPASPVANSLGGKPNR